MSKGEKGEGEAGKSVRSLSLSLHATTPSLTGEIVCVCVNFLCYKKDIIKSAQ